MVCCAAPVYITHDVYFGRAAVLRSRLESGGRGGHCATCGEAASCRGVLSGEGRGAQSEGVQGAQGVHGEAAGWGCGETGAETMSGMEERREEEERQEVAERPAPQDDEVRVQ